MDRLEVAREVADLLADEDVDILQGVESYQCVLCGRQARTTESPAAVVVMAGSQRRWVRLSHQLCGRSGILDESPDFSAVPGAVSLRAAAVLLPDSGGRHFPGLVVDVPGYVSTSTERGDRVDLLVSGLLDRGLTLVTSPTVPPRAEGWTVGVSASNQVTVADPEGGQVYEGDLGETPPQWRQMADAEGVTLLVATLGLADLSDLSALVRALQETADAGQLAGGLVETSFTG